MLRTAALLCLISCLARPVAAYEADDYVRGKAALIDNRFDEARVAFSRALQAAADPPARWRALLGLGLAAELAGDAHAAVLAYRRFLDASAAAPEATHAPWPERRAEIALTARRLERTLLTTAARLEVTTDPPTARVRIVSPDHARTIQGVAPLREYLEPGRWQIEVEHDDHHPFERELVLVAGIEDDLHVRLERVSSPPAERLAQPLPLGPPPPPDPAASTREVHETSRDPAPSAGVYVLAGAVALAAAGGVFTWGALSAHDELEDLSDDPGTPEVLRRFDRAESRMRDYETAAWICYGATAAAIGTGVALLVLQDDEPPVDLGIGPAPSGIRANVGLRF